MKSPTGDVQKTHANISKAQKELGYSPNMLFEDGVRNCIKWCIETQNIISKI